MTSAGLTARARARAEITGEIKAAARRQLADTGAAELSLRAIARELGMVSSAVYRYFASRDELLTALIIDAYDALGSAAEVAAAAPGELGERWLRFAVAVRAWAVANPQDYALVYGSPVPGYLAPGDTVRAAARVAVVALGIVADAVRKGEIGPSGSAPVPAALRGDFARLRDEVAPEVPDEVLARALYAWAQLFGGISLELFGHFHNVIGDHGSFFEHQMSRTARLLAVGP